MVRAPNREVETFHPRLQEGEHADLAVMPGEPIGREKEPARQVAAPTHPVHVSAPVPSASGKAPLEAAKDGNTSTVGYIIGGIGAAALITSVVAGAIALGKNSTVDGHCERAPSGSGRVCDQTGLSAASTGKTMAIVSDMSLAIGLVGVGAGTYLVVGAGNSAGHEHGPEASLVLQGAF